MREPRFIVAAALCCGLFAGGLSTTAVCAQDASILQSPELTPERSKPRSSEAESAETGPEAENPFADHLETDRDSFTPATTTVNRGRWIMESSYSFIDNRRAPDTNSFPELVLRYGLGENFELRMGWNFEAGGGGNIVSSIEGDEGLEGAKFERESRVSYGFKWRVTRQSDWLPESSVLVQGFTPTSGDAAATEGAVTYVWGWELPQRWKLDGAIRYASSTDNEDDFAIWNPSTVLRIPVTEQVAVHAEYFGAIPQGRAGGQSQHFFSPGLHFLPTPDLEIGFRVGWGLNDASARFFVNSGVGMRF
ncbi:MAG TPA: transporter [Planctomycetaceae bacterium]